MIPDKFEELIASSSKDFRKRLDLLRGSVKIFIKHN